MYRQYSTKALVRFMCGMQVLSLAGCHRVSPIYDRITVAPVPTAMIGEKTDRRAFFVVSAVVSNRTSHNLYLDGCGDPPVQRLVGDTWRDVRAPMCAGSWPDRRIPPGDSIRLTFEVVDREEFVTLLGLVAKVVPGTYRLQIVASVDDPQTRTRKWKIISSSPFKVYPRDVIRGVTSANPALVHVAQQSRPTFFQARNSGSPA